MPQTHLGLTLPSYGLRPHLQSCLQLPLLLGVQQGGTLTRKPRAGSTAEPGQHAGGTRAHPWCPLEGPPTSQHWDSLTGVLNRLICKHTDPTVHVGEALYRLDCPDSHREPAERVCTHSNMGSHACTMQTAERTHTQCIPAPMYTCAHTHAQPSSPSPAHTSAPMHT